MRRTGINDKMVFYVRRYSDRLNGSYFEYRENKEVCNPNEKLHFYLKVGGITYLPKKTVPGKKINASAESVKESNCFGSYVYYGDIDKKIRTLLYGRRKGMPDSKLVSKPAVLHSVIPRYDGQHPDILIKGMTICQSYGAFRRWTRFDGPEVHGMISHHMGFYEVDSNEKWENTAYSPDDSVFAIYIGANTSLLMVDITQPHLYKDYNKNYIYTLFQEGSLILLRDMNIFYSFYDEEEGNDFDGYRLVSEKRHLMEGTENLSLLDTTLATDKGRIVFLKSAPNHTFWTLRMSSRYRGIDYGRDKHAQICIPTGGQFEKVLHWMPGVYEVNRLQSLKPWQKYVENIDSVFDENDNKLADDPVISDIDMDRNEAYPQTP